MADPARYCAFGVDFCRRVLSRTNIQAVVERTRIVESDQSLPVSSVVVDIQSKLPGTAQMCEAGLHLLGVTTGCVVVCVHRRIVCVFLLLLPFV